MKKKTKFSNLFYSKEALKIGINEFKEESEIKILDNSFLLEFDIKKEYDEKSVIGEFQNFALSIMKSQFKDKVKKKPCTKSRFKKFNLNNIDYFYNFYRFKKLNNKYLLVNETSNFIFLNEKEFNDFRSSNFEENQDLLEKLIKKKFIFENNNFSKLVEKKRNKLSFLFQGPSLHIVVVTLRCNLRCSYCHASSVPINKEGFDLEEEKARETVNRIFDSPSKLITIEFQGGEPLLNFNIIKYIILYATQKNKILKKDLKFALVSNFVYMNDEILDFLIKYDVGICTSLDGPENIHNKNRQEYAKTVYWIKKINEIYRQRNLKRKVKPLPVITNDSLNFHKQIVDEYVNLGLDSIFLRQLNPLGFANLDKDIFYSYSDYIEFWKKLINYIIELNKKGVKIYDNFTKILLQKIFLNLDPNYCELRNPCGAVTGQLLYNYDGNIYSCDEGRMVSEDLFKIGTVYDTFQDIMTNSNSCSIIASSVNDVHHCQNCLYKPYCGICPVLNYQLGNSVISNITSQDRCKILKAQFDYIFDKLENDDDAKKILLSWI